MPGIIKKADSIIVNSSLTKEDVIKFQASANSKLNTIFPDIDIPNSTQKAKHAQGKYLLTVGTIEPRKNYKLLIDAFKSTLEELVHTDVIILVIDINDSVSELKKKFSRIFILMNLLCNGDVRILIWDTESFKQGNLFILHENALFIILHRSQDVPKKNF